VVTALALEVAGVPREAIIADYLLSNDRLDHVNEALLATPTYAHSLRGRDRSTLLVVADTVRRVLESLDPVGGAVGWLSAAGLTDDELEALRVKLGVASRGVAGDDQPCRGVVAGCGPPPERPAGTN
jgi:protein tyrosine/serine phosphatase